MKRIKESEVFVQQKRTKRTYERRWKNAIARRNRAARLKQFASQKRNVYQSAIIDFVNQYGKQPLINKRTNARIVLPKKFSLISSPEDTLLEINRLALAFRSEKLRSVRIDFREVSDIDLGAASVMHYLIKEFQLETKRQRKTVAIRDVPSASEPVRQYFESVGLFPKKRKKANDAEPGTQRVMRMMSSQEYASDSFQKSTRHERACATLINYIDDCLSVQDRSLTVEGKRRLAIYAGEILNNATEHSGQESWCITGRMDFSKGQYICEVIIFNFGHSIADTFKDLDKDSLGFRQIRPYIEEHRKRKVFSNTWKQDNLITLAALQGHISSKLDENPDRGQGSVQLIEFFQRIYEECNQNPTQKAEMALISGATYIYFDGTYKMSDDASRRKVIAFNRQNSLMNPPDPNFVRVLNGEAFPGTAIAIRFPLQASQIRESRNA